jgi:hypothetical protein
VPNSDDTCDHREITKIEYELLSDTVKSLSIDIKDIKLGFEQFRRDIVTGFVPRDILDLRVVNMQAQMTVLEQKLSDLKEEIRINEQKAIGHVERTWLRMGTLGGLIGVIVAVLEFLQKAH